MMDDQKITIQNKIPDLAEITGLLSIKYTEEPLLDVVQIAFHGPAVHTGRALDIQFQ